MNNKKNLIYLFSAIAVVMIIVGSILWFGNKKEKEKVTIGVIMPGFTEEEGWNGTHYAGIRDACEELGVEIRLYENIPEYSGACERAVREMAEERIRFIILESYHYYDEIKEVISEYEDITFCCCFYDRELPNYFYYFARVYQARYLSGIVAGMTTQSNHIGYVAAMDTSEVNRGINAFTLGVRSVNPSAVVHVVYTGAWDNEEKEKTEAAALVEDCQADVLTYHQNQPFVVEEAERLDVDVIGYNIEQGAFSDNLLTSVVSRWDIVYREIIGDYLQGKNTGKQNYWLGMEKGAVGLAFYSEAVSQEMKDAVDRASEMLLNGQEVFSGLIYDHQGNLRCDENEVIRDETLNCQMNWLVEGVELYESH